MRHDSDLKVHGSRLGSTASRFSVRRVSSEDLQSDDEASSSSASYSFLEANPQNDSMTRSTSVFPVRLFKTWKKEFLEDRCCAEDEICKEIVVSAIPHLILNFLLVFYLIFGAFVIVGVDENIGSRTFNERFLFLFTTISTIGYGDIVPTSSLGKLCIIFYCVLGIPMIVLVLSNNGKLIVHIYNLVWQTIDEDAENCQELPLHVCVSLLATHILLGGFIFSMWIDHMTFVNSVYFCFISISTIGFGDLVPTPITELEFIVVVVYISSGIVILSTLTGEVSLWVRWIHNKGKRVDNSELTEIWFGGKCLTVKDLVVMVSDQFQCPPGKLRDVLHDLDGVLEYACNKRPSEDVESKSEKVAVKSIGCSRRSWEEENTQNSVSSQQRTLPGDTELAINTLATISHQLRKASLRHSHHYNTVTKPANSTARKVSVRQTSENYLEIRNQKANLAAYIEAVNGRHHSSS